MTKSFLSSSIDRKIAECFLVEQLTTPNENNPRAMTKVNGTFIRSWVMCIYHIKYRCSALHIEDSSQYANEEEVLIMPYTVFQMKNIIKTKPSYLLYGQVLTEIHLEESDQYLNI